MPKINFDGKSGFAFLPVQIKVRGTSFFEPSSRVRFKVDTGRSTLTRTNLVSVTAHARTARRVHREEPYFIRWKISAKKREQIARAFKLRLN
ncbi:MAG: hypothetical protein FWD35_02110 [Oscillospiraceae bacterium]|nr:hypothetical protein [Oscillospiraceae bacterium]